MNKIKFLLFAWILVFLWGCAATHTAISKRNLDVQTKMSQSIFLDPVSNKHKTVFIQTRNTTGNSQFSIDRKLAHALVDKGYTVVEDPEEAHYLVQSNVLQIAKADLRESEDVLAQGFGGGLFSAAVAATAGADGRGTLGVGLAGAAISMVGDAMVKDVYYSVITDVQISERSEDTLVTESLTSNLQQGTQGKRTISATEHSDWKRYQTRIISTANKVNLNIEDAVPELVAGISDSISGLM